VILVLIIGFGQRYCTRTTRRAALFCRGDACLRIWVFNGLRWLALSELTAHEVKNKQERHRRNQELPQNPHLDLCASVVKEDVASVRLRPKT